MTTNIAIKTKKWN